MPFNVYSEKAVQYLPLFESILELKSEVQNLQESCFSLNFEPFSIISQIFTTTINIFDTTIFLNLISQTRLVTLSKLLLSDSTNFLLSQPISYLLQKTFTNYYLI